MKRRLRLFLLMVIGLLLIGGCREKEELMSHDVVNALEGVTMVFEEGTVSSEKGTVLFVNETATEYTYGEYFELEWKKDGDWVQVPTVLKSYGFNDIGYTLQPFESAAQIIEWEWLYGVLESGEYRLVKEILERNEAGNPKTHMLAAEFEVE